MMCPLLVRYLELEVEIAVAAIELAREEKDSLVDKVSLDKLIATLKLVNVIRDSGVTDVYVSCMNALNKLIIECIATKCLVEVSSPAGLSYSNMESCIKEMRVQDRARRQYRTLSREGTLKQLKLILWWCLSEEELLWTDSSEAIAIRNKGETNGIWSAFQWIDSMKSLMDMHPQHASPKEIRSFYYFLRQNSVIEKFPDIMKLMEPTLTKVMEGLSTSEWVQLSLLPVGDQTNTPDSSPKKRKR